MFAIFKSFFLLSFFIFRIGKYAEASNQNSKSATIEMYAPSSYNDTVTGETLSSVSEKSDSYSNEGSQPDYMVSALIYFVLYRFQFQGRKSFDRQTDRPNRIESNWTAPKIKIGRDWKRTETPIIWTIKEGCKNYSMNSIWFNWANWTDANLRCQQCCGFLRIHRKNRRILSGKKCDKKSHYERAIKTAITFLWPLHSNPCDIANWYLLFFRWSMYLVFLRDLSSAAFVKITSFSSLLLAIILLSCIFCVCVLLTLYSVWL